LAPKSPAKRREVGVGRLVPQIMTRMSKEGALGPTSRRHPWTQKSSDNFYGDAVKEHKKGNKSQSPLGGLPG